MPKLEQQIENALFKQLELERQRAAETPDHSPKTRALAFAVRAVAKAIKAGVIPETDSVEVLKYYREHGKLPQSLAAFAISIPEHTLDERAKATMLRITSELKQLSANAQNEAADEIYRQWPSIRRLALEGTGQSKMAIAKQLLGIAGHPIPSAPDYFESLVYGYFYDLDPVSGLVTFLTETIKLRFSEVESSSEGCMVLRGEGKHPTPNGEVISKLRAERITESAFQLTARFPSGSGFTSSFTRSVKGVLLGAWAGGSNHKGRDIFSPMFLSAEPFDDESSLIDYVGEVLPKDKELMGN